MSGATKAPRKSTLVAIETVLSAEERRRNNIAGMGPGRSQSYTNEDLPETYGTVKESAVGYNLAPEKKKKDGEYTLDDYYALPDERRVELIDGVFYDMSAPAVIHPMIWVRNALKARRISRWKFSPLPPAPRICFSNYTSIRMPA